MARKILVKIWKLQNQIHTQMLPLFFLTKKKLPLYCPVKKRTKAHKSSANPDWECAETSCGFRCPCCAYRSDPSTSSLLPAISAAMNALGSLFSSLCSSLMGIHWVLSLFFDRRWVPWSRRRPWRGWGNRSFWRRRGSSGGNGSMRTMEKPSRFCLLSWFFLLIVLMYAYCLLKCLNEWFLHWFLLSMVSGAKPCYRWCYSECPLHGRKGN